jgi:hypothetical protein
VPLSPSGGIRDPDKLNLNRLNAAAEKSSPDRAVAAATAPHFGALMEDGATVCARERVIEGRKSLAHV